MGVAFQPILILKLHPEMHLTDLKVLSYNSEDRTTHKNVALSHYYSLNVKRVKISFFKGVKFVKLTL